MKNKILVLGASGFIGSWVYDKFVKEGYDVVGTSYHSNKFIQLDIGNLKQLDDLVLIEKPDVIINCVGVVGKLLCEKDTIESEKANLTGVKNISKICIFYGIKLIHISTIVVHNGLKEEPYTEEDNPTERVGDKYNFQKSLAERYVEKVPNSIILRLGDLYGYKVGNINYLGGESFRVIYNLLKQGATFEVYKRIKTNKTLVSDLGIVIFELLKSNFEGRLNVGGDTIENYDFCKKMKETFNLTGTIKQIDSPLDYPGHKLFNLSKLNKLGIKLNTIEDGFKILKEDLK